MQDPERLLSRGATEFERRLLSAVKDERPSLELQLRMEQALSFTGGGAAAPAGMVAKAWHASWLKLGVGGLVAGGMVAGGLVVSSTIGASRVSEPGAAATEVTSSPAVPAPALLDSGASAAERQGAAPVRPGVGPVMLPDEATLREEIELLDAVRTELSLGRTAGARRALARYERRFAAGVLQREARVLRGRVGGAAPARRVDPGAASRR